jgi:hypothetical protein
MTSLKWMGREVIAAGHHHKAKPYGLPRLVLIVGIYGIYRPILLTRFLPLRFSYIHYRDININTEVQMPLRRIALDYLKFRAVSHEISWYSISAKVALGF